MSAVSPRSPHGRSLTGLFSDLWRETSTLVREETALAKAEISEKVSHVESGLVSLAVGGAVLFAGLIVLLFAAVGALDLVVPAEHAGWLSPLIVGVVVALVGMVMLGRARRELKGRNLTPTRTLASLQRDGRLAKEHLR